MTYDDDMARLFLSIGTQTIPLKDLGLEWPPPAELTEINGLPLDEPMTLRQCSQLTDDQRAETTFLVRGCVYRYKSDMDDRT